MSNLKLMPAIEDWHKTNIKKNRLHKQYDYYIISKVKNKKEEN